MHGGIASAWDVARIVPTLVREVTSSSGTGNSTPAAGMGTPDAGIAVPKVLTQLAARRYFARFVVTG